MGPPPPRTRRRGRPAEAREANMAAKGLRPGDGDAGDLWRDMI